MNHSFNVDDAQKYGIPAAILLDHFRHWITKNRANDKHFREDRTWSYNSVKAFTELYPYMGIKQIRSALDKLVEEGVLLKRDLNEGKADRTLWYAFRDEEAQIGVRGHLPKKANGMSKRDEAYAENGNCSISTTTYAATYTNSTPPSASSVKFSALAFLLAQGVDSQVASDWLAVCKGARKVVTQTKLDEFQTEITRAGMTWDAVIRLCCSRNWVSFNADWASDRRSTSRAVAPAGQSQPGMSAKTAATVANLNAYFGDN